MAGRISASLVEREVSGGQIGTASSVQWQIPYESAAGPVPAHVCGAPDFASLPRERLVKNGQVLVRVARGRMPFQAGSGVQTGADWTHLLARTNGVVEIQGDRVIVHPLEWIVGNLNNVTQEFAGGVVIQGDATASTIRAAGPISVLGTVAGCSLRSQSDIVVGRCARSRLTADGDIYVLAKLLHCQVITRQRVVAATGSVMLGGEIAAMSGVSAADAGSPDGTKTLIAAAVDRYTAFRQDEVDRDIARHRESIQKIARALRPLGASGLENVPQQKRQLMQALDAQRCGLEERVRLLNQEKRGLVMAYKNRLDADVCIAGTIYPGVTVQVDQASVTFDEMLYGVWIDLNSFRESLIVRPLEERSAA